MQPSPRNQILHNSRAGLSLVCFRWCMIWDTVFSLKLDCDVLAKLSLHRVSEWSERPQTCTRQGNTRVLSCWKRNRSNTHPHHAELSRRELAIFEPAMPSPSTHVAIATEPNLAQLPGWLVTGLLSLMHDLRHSVLRHFHNKFAWCPQHVKQEWRRLLRKGARSNEVGAFMSLQQRNPRDSSWHQSRQRSFIHAKFLGCMCALITSDPNPLQLSTIIYNCATDP